MCPSSGSSRLYSEGQDHVGVSGAVVGNGYEGACVVEGVVFCPPGVGEGGDGVKDKEEEGGGTEYRRALLFGKKRELEAQSVEDITAPVRRSVRTTI